MINFPKKITVSTCGFETRVLEAIAEERKPKAVSVLRVFGMVSSRENGMTQFGPYTKFRGELAALNLQSGEEFRSQQLILPAIAETVVNSLFDKASKDQQAANIALEITVTFNDSNKGGTKFAYGVKPLYEYKEDSLSVIAKQLPPPVMVNDQNVPAGKSKK